MSTNATPIPYPVERLVAQLERIAEKNDETFRYSIDVEPRRNQPCRYTFNCRESADRHEFVSAAGDSIEEAVAKAQSQIERACKDWGYETAL